MKKFIKFISLLTIINCLFFSLNAQQATISQINSWVLSPIDTITIRSVNLKSIQLKNSSDTIVLTPVNKSPILNSTDSNYYFTISTVNQNKSSAVYELLTIDNSNNVVQNNSSIQLVKVLFQNYLTQSINVFGNIADNNYGNIIPTLTNIIEVSAGAYHNLFLLKNGQVYHKQGAINAVITDSAVAIYAGNNFSVILLTNGKFKILGLNITSLSNVPNNLSGKIVQMALGQTHIAALNSNNQLFVWGNNLNNKTTIPAQIMNNVQKIVAGSYHTIALLNNGSIITWGNNDYNQLDSSGLPQNTLNSTYKIIDVAAGLYSSIYLRSDSTLIFKGNLAYGDVRFNANTYNSLPNKITKIFAKGTNVFAIDVNNRLFSWGDPSYDKLNAPTANSNVVSVAPGYYQNLTTNSFNISVLLDTTKATYSFSNKYLTRGANIQLFIRPKSASYKIKELKINGILSDSTNTYTFNNLFSNQLVEANIESIYSPYIRSTSKAVVKAGDTLNVYGKNISNIITQQGNYLLYESLPIFQKFANDIDSTYRVIIPAGKEEKVYAIYGENMIDGINEKSAKWLFRYTGINTDSVVPYIWSFSASKFDSTYIKYFPNNINNVIDVKLGIGRAIVLLNNGTIATFPIQNTSDNQSQWANWALSQSNVVRISMSSTAGYGATGAVPTAYVLKSDGSIAGFGSDVNTEISGQPENLNNVIDISSGTYHTIALLNDGRVKAWGLNKYPNYFTKNELNNIVSISAGRGVGQYFATDNSGNLNLLNIDSDTISNITNTADLTKIGYYSNTLKILDTAPLILDTLIPTKVKFANGFDGFSVFVSDSNNKLSAIGKFPQDLGFQTKTVQEQINQIPDSLITNIDHITLNSNFVFTQTKQSIRYIRRELTINEINNPQNTYLISEPKIFQNKSLYNVNQVSVSETNGILLGKLRVIIKGDSQQTFIPNTVYLKRGDSYTVRFYPKTNFIIDSIFINGKYDTNKLSYTFNNIQTIQFVEIKTRPTITYISNINQLDSLANGNYQNKYPLNTMYILTRNLNFNDTNSYSDVSIKARLTSGIGGWKPIGSAAFPFRGIFNGNGFTITNFYINNTNSYNGFFGYVLNGRIQNLNLISNIVNCGNASGILAGTTINTWVDNSSTKGILTSSGNNIGGIIGDAQNSKITNSYSTAYIRSVTQNIGNYGILIGLMNGGIVSNCYTRGTVSIPNLNGQIQSGFIAQTTGAAVKIYNSYSRSQMFTTQYGSIIGSSNNALDSIFYCYSSLLQSLITGQAKQFRSLVYYKTNLPDSILAPSNAYQLQSLYYPRLYKLNSQELLDGQNQDNLKPSNLHYKNDTISLGIFVAGRFEKTSFFVGDAPLIKFSIAASNIPLDQISIDSIIGGLTIKNRIASGKYSIVVKAANVFGETLDTLTVFITPVIEISSINQLDSIGKFSKYSTNGNYILTRNLDFRNDSSYSDTTGFKARLTSGNGFSGIENFSGSFSGSNFTIRNLFQRNRTNGGFFNSTSNALIQNLGLVDVSLDNRLGAVGALVGVNSAFALLGAVTKINNCYATGIVYGEAFGVGGLIGLNNDSFEITNSYFKGQVTGNYGVGGFIGVDFGRGSRVSNCYSYGKLLVRTNPAFYSGSAGFVSRIIGNATYNNCYANVSVNIVNSVNLANIYIGGSFIANFGGGTYKIQLNNCYSVDTKPFYGYLNNGIRNQFSSVIINNSISSTDINQINKTLQSSPYFKLSPNSYPLLYRLDNSNNLTLLGGQDSLSAPADFRYNDSNIINSYQNAAELRYTPILNFGTGVHLKFGFVGAIVQNINLDSTNGAIWWNRNLAAGQYNLQVQVSSSAGTLTTNLTLKIKPVINIEFLDQLNLIGVSPSYPANASYRLTRNLNFDSASHYYNSPIITNFNPIGSANVPFIGYFDGSNFTITNLRSTTNGLFGFVGSNACFNNIRLINEQISSNTVNGGLIGNLISGSFGLIINNCYTTGNITNTNSTSGYSGGLVGGGAANALVIRNSFSLMNINGNGSGLIGRANRRVIILNSYYRGIITLTNNSSVYCGGLMGFNTGLAYIRNSYAQAQFKLSNSANVYGGLLGYSNDGYLEYCYATTNILNQPLIANISETDIVYYSTNNYINPSQLNYSNQYQFIGSALPFVFYQNTSKLLDSQVNQQTFVVVLQNYDGQIALREQVIAGENFTARYSAPLGYVIDSVWLNGRNIDSIYGRYTITNINQNYVFVVKYKIATSRFIIYKTEGGSVYINNRQLINNLDTTLIAYRFSSSIFIEADSNYIIDTIWLNGNLYNNLATSISNKISFLSFSNIISDNFVKISFRKINPPLKPIIDTIISGKNSVVVSFRSPIPVTGSETILYRITAYPTKTTVYSRNSPSLILGLPNNTPLRFTVTAINISGETVSDTSQVITLSDSNYFINTYTLNAGGTISPSISAVLGSTKTIRFNADNNYLIDSVVVDGRGVSGYKGLDSGTYTFNYINANHFVQVIFRKISYRISVQTNSGGALLVNGRYIRLAGSVIVFKGDSTNVTIIPNFGTSIDSIFVNNTLVSDAQIQTDDQGLDYFILSNINANQFVRVVFKLNTFNINIATNNNILGYVNPQGQVLVLKGQRLVVNYVAYFGNVIDSVIVNGVAVSTNRTGQNLYAGYYLFDNISGDSNIRIVFKQLYFNVRITSNNSSGGIVTPQGRVILQRGDSIRVYVFAAARFVIDSIIINGNAIAITPNSKTYQYLFKNINGDSSLMVKFKQIYYNISSSYVGMGDISPLGQVRVLNSTNFTFNFYPLPGYHVSKLILNNKDTIKYAANTNIIGYTFNNIQANQNLLVVFDLLNVGGSVKTPIIFAGEPKRYTIYSSSNEVGVVPVQGRVEYDSGTRQVFNFVIPGGYRLDSVLLDGVQQPLIDSLVLNNLNVDHTIRVVVNPNGKFVISTLVSQGGSIVQSGNNVLDAGSSKTISIAIDDNYQLDSVIVDGVLINSSQYQFDNNMLTYTFNNIQSNHNLNVVLDQKLFNINFRSNYGGSLSLRGTQLVAYNDNITVQFYPNAGYRIAAINIDGQSIFSTLNSFTFRNISDNHDFEIVFELLQANIIKRVVINNNLESSDTTFVETGVGNTVSINALTGYTLGNVTVNGVMVSDSNITQRDGNYYYVINNVNSDNTIIFNLIQNITIATTAIGGSITPSLNLNYGDTVKVSYRGNKGYIVSRVFKNGQDITASTTISADSNSGSLWYIANSNDSIRVVFVQKYFGIDFIQLSVTQPVCNVLNAVGFITINFKQYGRYNINLLNTVNNKDTSFYTPLNMSYTFNNIVPSVYRIVISDSNYPQLMRTFVVTISVPAAITTYSNVIPNQQLLALDIKTGNVGYANLNGIIYQNLSGQNQLPLKNGVNTLVLKNSETCEDSVVQTIVYSEGISLYPNPAQNYTNLNIGGSDVEVTIELLMENGQVVKQELRHIDANRNVRLNLDGLNAGVYIIKVKGKQISGTLKLIKN